MQRPHLTALLAALASAAVLAARPVEADPGDPPTRAYVVQDGDTCLGIAIREVGDRAALQVIHRLNPLGPLPHVLRPGQVLKLPLAGGAPDARLTASIGLIGVRRAAAEAWDAARHGMELFRSWRVRSEERSSAVVTFRDDSVVSMRENTVVIIYGPSARAAAHRSVGATLESGALRTRLAELGRLELATDSAEIGLGPGSALVSVDAGGTARLANHEGRPARLRGRRGRRAAGAPVEVTAGKGSRVERGRAPTPPRPLPPRPVWRDAPVLVLGWRHQGVSLHGAWNPTVRAAFYRIELARDPGGRDVIAALRLPGRAAGFEAHGLAPGVYHVSVAAIDADGMEGPPSARVAMQAVALDLGGSGARGGGASPARDMEAAPRDPSVVPDEVVVAPGSIIVPPEGLACAVGPGALRAGALAAAGSGRIVLRCASRSGKSASLPLTVASVRVVATAPGRSGTGGRPTLMRGSRHVIELELASAVLLAGTPTASSRDPVDLEVLSASPNRLRLAIRPRDGSGPRVRVQLALTTAAGPVVLDEVDLRVVAAPPRTGRFVLGGFGGRSGDAFGDDGPSGARLAGVRLAFRPRGRVALELEGTLSDPEDTVGRQRGALRVSPLVSLEQPLFGRALGRVRVGLFAHRGLDDGGGSSDRRGGGHEIRIGHVAAAGLALGLSDYISARVDLAHLVGDGLPRWLELTAGLELRFPPARD